MKSVLFAILSVPFVANFAFADIASVEYVDEVDATKVSTQQSANQTLSGTYVVTGMLEVETAALPSVE